MLTLTVQGVLPWDKGLEPIINLAVYNTQSMDKSCILEALCTM